MSRILVSYFTQTGNTEKVAGAIHDAVLSEGHESELRSTDGLCCDDLDGYDLVFLGSACHSATLAEPVLKLLNDIPCSSRLKMAGFATHSCMLPEGSDRDRELYERWASGCPGAFETAQDDGKIQLLGYFGCVGAPSKPIEAFINSTIVTDDVEWQEYIAHVSQHPDEEDLLSAGKFAREILGKLD